ncbi:DASH family cryptochrome [Halobellus sp. Atlit-38R]|uniref:DASH family cryptochrome n=1 Tax=Halobellus sp. Atlit-38R TaxID=2282131 RepID=UPI000EF1F5E6|nr:DASH family cryptochrome [Halobellus sp. Atlit-38R]RLM89627.1 DASH family cryptochrome [Halobellus sp. Atlit-38R]
MMPDTAIAWFRRDLRTHDNEALAAAAAADRVLPVYCVDPRTHGVQPYGGADSFPYEKLGTRRARFRRESLDALRDRLRGLGSDLLVRRGRPEVVLPNLADAVDADVVTFHDLPGPDERSVRAAVTAALRERGVTPRRFWGRTLHHIADLPAPYTAISDTYTKFRKSVEADAIVRETYPRPSLPPVPAGDDPGVDADAVRPDSISDVGVAGNSPGSSDAEPGAGADADEIAERAVHPFPGGEDAALDRLTSYIWEGDHLREYRETRNGLVGPDYSSKFSPWLNEGCLSPRRIYEEVKRYERERVSNDSTYWLLFELRWRDFFQFQLAKHGAQFFAPGGLRRRDDVDWRWDEQEFERWRTGQTGIPFVDANVRELNATGYLSNRGRQNVASFLVNDLTIDWRRGAAYFETQLLDYDPASNYGNWAYIAGVGNDSRQRAFDVLAQAHQYDPKAEYVARWIPELDGLVPQKAHEPWTLSESEQARYGVELGVDYPRPMIDPTTSGDDPV